MSVWDKISVREEEKDKEPRLPPKPIIELDTHARATDNALMISVKYSYIRGIEEPIIDKTRVVALQKKIMKTIQDIVEDESGEKFNDNTIILKDKESDVATITRIDPDGNEEVEFRKLE